MKSITFSICFFLLAAIGALVLAQSSPAPKQNLGAPLIIADLTDGTDSYTGAFAANRLANWATTFQTAINNFISGDGLSAASVTFSTPNYVDTQGNFLNGILGVNNLFVSGTYTSTQLPPFIVISETSTTTLEVLITVRKLLGSATNVPIFITSTVNEFVVRDAPNVIRINGDDSEIASNFVDILYALSQSSLCLLYDLDMDGYLFQRTLTASLTGRPKGYPILLRSVAVANGARGFGSDNFAQTDDAAMLQLASGATPCTAVLVAGEGSIASRVFAARQRAAANTTFGASASNALANMFFFFTPSTTACFPNTAGNNLVKQSLLTNSNFKNTASLAQQLSLTADQIAGLTDTFGLIISPVLDAISLAAVAASSATDKTNFLPSIFSVTLNGGATTPFQIAPFTRSRAKAEARVRLLVLGAAAGSSSTAATTSIATWVGSQGSTTPVTIDNANAVPRQAAEPFVICLVGQQSCPTLSALNHAYFTLLSTAPNTLPASTSIFVKAISAGVNGITTIGNMASQVTSCDFVLGPGSSTTARNLFPFFSAQNVPMIDYASSDTTLSSRISFSTYTRVNPTDEYVARVAGSVFKNFGWESVAIVTSLDNYGEQIVAAYTAGLGRQRVGVEASIMIPSNLLNNNDTVYKTLQKVQNQLITRIILLQISATDEVHQLFFRNIVDLGMTNTQIFWLSDSLCQYASQNPDARNALQNSMCASPQYDANAYRQQYMNLFNSDGADAQRLFREGGFDISTCNLRTSDMYAPFASDAALTILNVVKRIGDLALGNKDTIAKIQSNITQMMGLIRDSHVLGVTGIVAFDPNSNERTNAAYSVDMQQPNQQLIKFAQWNSGTGFAALDLPTPLIWFNNGTTVPSYTTRDIRFIVVTTVTRNTASVVFSILGFIITVSLFCFCYKHYKLQKMVAGVQEQQNQQQQNNNINGGNNNDIIQQTPQNQQYGVSVEMKNQSHIQQQGW